MSKVIDICIFSGEKSDLVGNQKDSEVLPTNEVAQKIHHEIKGKPCLLMECGVSIIEAKIGRKFDKNYIKQTPESIRKKISSMRKEALATTGLI